MSVVTINATLQLLEISCGVLFKPGLANSILHTFIKKKALIFLCFPFSYSFVFLFLFFLKSKQKITLKYIFFEYLTIVTK